jgi:hypothetical protein
MSNWSKVDPTESGDYIVKVRGCGRIRIETDYYSVTLKRWRWYPDRVVMWAKVPEDKEEE